jgi:hypothetical protein
MPIKIHETTHAARLSRLRALIHVRMAPKRSSVRTDGSPVK